MYDMYTTARPKGKEKNSIFFVFNYKNKALKKGEEGHVSIYWYHSRRAERYRRLFKCKAENWDKKKSRVKTNHKEHLRLNALLNKIEQDYSKMLFNLQNEEKELTPEIFQEFYLTVTNQSKKRKDNFFRYFNEFIASEIDKEIKERILESSTIETHADSLRLLNEFNSKIEVNQLEELPHNFEVFLRGKGLAARSTVKKHQKNIQKFLGLYLKAGKKLGKIEPELDPYSEFNIGAIKGDRLELTLEEVDKIANVKLEPGSLYDVSRDRFLFSCETGLRLSDNRNLKTDFLHVSDIDGISIQMHRMIKVDYELNLNLRQLFNGRPEKILLKYISVEQIREAQKKKESVYIFPEMSEDTIRNRLKVVKNLAGIHKEITFHSSRHTFGTNLADTGAGLDLIMELMGITSPNTVRGYIHRSNERRKRKLGQLNWNIHRKEDRASNSEAS